MSFFLDENPGLVYSAGSS